jgi:hypothetical protein
MPMIMFDLQFRPVAIASSLLLLWVESGDKHLRQA